MSNKQINQQLKAFDNARKTWVEIMVESNGASNAAAQMILSINSKMELLRTLWNWSDETVEMAVPL